MELSSQFPCFLSTPQEFLSRNWLWHGAGWNFVLFGLLHGSYIVIYNVWVKIKYNFPKIKIVKKAIISNTLAKIITFLAITFSFVLFRAESLNGATNILSSMLGA